MVAMTLRKWSFVVLFVVVGCSDGKNPAVGSGDGATVDGGAVARSGKRGVAYGFTSVADLSAPGTSVSWWYNWTQKPDAAVAAALPQLGIEYVPMVWGGTFDAAKVEADIPSGAKYLLAFNEPNFAAQSNLTPEQAAALWPQIEKIADARNLKIVSPALNYCGGSCNETDPFVWLQKFFAACVGCRVDYIALHWYACTGDALKSYLTSYKSKFDKPLWLTEFSCLDDASITVDKEATYMSAALSILESDPIVFRYAWFTGRDDSQHTIDLLSGDGVLTPLGKTYSSY